MTPTNWKGFFTALVVLAAVHSLVSFCAYRFLTKRLEGPWMNSPMVDVTTPEQRARGEASFTGLNSKVVKTVIPTPLLYYIWFGYAGLASALVVAIYYQIFQK